MLTLGIDEVGRGAWAGPLVVGAVVLDSARVPDDLADSKKLSKQQREKLSPQIKQSAAAIGVGWVTAETVDKIGLGEALKLAARRAVKQIPPEILSKLDQIIIDGTINLLAGSEPAKKVTVLPKADAKIAAVSAAAIVAKVFRDNYMTQLEHVFPHHDFARHVGYGTSLHQQKLREFGAIIGIHRQSFAPIREMVSGAATTSRAGSFVTTKAATTEPRNDGREGVVRESSAAKADKISETVGRIAENVATKHLEKLGHEIIAQNWKTKFCEIDIISERNQTLYFTEVKYRASARHGDGLAAITPKKLQQMKFAAEFYLTKNADLTKNYAACLSAVSLSGATPQIDYYIETID